MLILFLCCAASIPLRADDVTVSNAPAVSTNLVEKDPVPALGQMPTPATIPAKISVDGEKLKKYQIQLDLGKQERSEKNTKMATETLSELIEDPKAPTEIKRLALFELALVSQDEDKLVRAEQIFAQYLHTYEDDPSTPEVLLRQGMIYRQMGVSTLAISKFYAVMSTALKLKLEYMDYYKRLVLQAQIEIADTYYQEGKYDQAIDFFRRLLKSNNPDLDLVQTHYKLVRSLSYSTNYDDTVAQAQNYLILYPNTPEVPEIRFFLASALKNMGRNNDAMKQVLALLQSQEENAHVNPELWTYWQQRAGNEIANELYKEGDFFNALQIYISLADLDKSPSWQLPAWYQIGLIYEQLQQWDKACDTYDRILNRQKDMTEATATPSLLSIFDMAKWRKDYIAWMRKAKMTQQSYVLTQNTNALPTLKQ